MLVTRDFTRQPDGLPAQPEAFPIFASLRLEDPTEVDAGIAVIQSVLHTELRGSDDTLTPTGVLSPVTIHRADLLSLGGRLIDSSSRVGGNTGPTLFGAEADVLLGTLAARSRHHTTAEIRGDRRFEKVVRVADGLRDLIHGLGQDAFTATVLAPRTRLALGDINNPSDRWLKRHGMPFSLVSIVPNRDSWAKGYTTTTRGFQDPNRLTLD